MYVSIYLSNYVSIHVQQSKTLYLCIYVYIYQSIKSYLSIIQSIYLPIHLSVYMLVFSSTDKRRESARAREGKRGSQVTGIVRTFNERPRSPDCGNTCTPSLLPFLISV